MSCIETKDRLLGMLNEADPELLLSNIDKVLTALELTSGIWQEANYAYKGCEIAQRCRNICDDALTHWCMNWKRRERLEKMKATAWTLSETFHALQQSSFCTH